MGSRAAVTSTGEQYGNPVESMTAFLAQLDRYPHIRRRSRSVGAVPDSPGTLMRSDDTIELTDTNSAGLQHQRPHRVPMR